MNNSFIHPNQDIIALCQSYRYYIAGMHLSKHYDWECCMCISTFKVNPYQNIPRILNGWWLGKYLILCGTFLQIWLWAYNFYYKILLTIKSYAIIN